MAITYLILAIGFFGISILALTGKMKLNKLSVGLAYILVTMHCVSRFIEIIKG